MSDRFTRSPGTTTYVVRDSADATIEVAGYSTGAAEHDGIVVIGDSERTHTLSIEQARKLCVALLVAIGDAVGGDQAMSPQTGREMGRQLRAEILARGNPEEIAWLDRARARVLRDLAEAVESGEFVLDEGGEQ